MRTLKLVIGILSCFLVLIVLFQSCGVSFITSIENSGDTSGAAGVIFAILLLAAGITAIAGRDSKGGTIGAGILYVIGGVLGVTQTGIYGDLQVWSWLSLIFGAIFLLSLFVKEAPRKQPEYHAEPAVQQAPIKTAQEPVSESSETESKEPENNDNPPKFAPNVRFGNMKLYVSPYISYNDQNKPLISKCLVVFGFVIIIASVAVGLVCTYSYFLSLVVHNLTLDYNGCVNVAIVVSATVSFLAGLALALPMFGIAELVNDVHAIRLCSQGYTIRNNH